MLTRPCANVGLEVQVCDTVWLWLGDGEATAVSVALNDRVWVSDAVPDQLTVYVGVVVVVGEREADGGLREPVGLWVRVGEGLAEGVCDGVAAERSASRAVAVHCIHPAELTLFKCPPVRG